jgi:hypothetical protein
VARALGTLGDERATRTNLKRALGADDFELDGLNFKPDPSTWDWTLRNSIQATLDRIRRDELRLSVLRHVRDSVEAAGGWGKVAPRVEEAVRAQVLLDDAKDAEQAKP